MSPAPLTPAVETDGASARSWRRWPCHKCGHGERRFSVLCPRCEALPWDDEIPAVSAAHRLSAGIRLESRGHRPFYARYRFATPMGFLGVLSRRLTGGAHWLGADGEDWYARRVGVLGRAWVLHNGRRALAAAEATDAWGTSFRTWQADHSYRLTRTGIARHNFLLAVVDGPEILRIRGGFMNPLRSVELLGDCELSAVLLSCALACSLRQGDGEG